MRKWPGDMGWEQYTVQGAEFGFCCSLNSCGKLGDMVYLSRLKTFSSMAKPFQFSEVLKNYYFLVESHNLDRNKRCWIATDLICWPLDSQGDSE